MAGSALAVLHISAIRVPESSGSISIQDYNPKGWVASLRQAFKEGQMVAVPNGLKCKDLSIVIAVPPGKTLHLQDRISDNGRGRFILQDGCKVIGDQGGSLRNITLDVHGSDCVIERIVMSGFGLVTQIYISGRIPRLIRSLTIQDITITRADYGVLHRGFHNRMDGIKITNCRFNNLQGDAVEWNVAINDNNVLISDHVVERINCTNGNVNWGIGIGLAGSAYDNTYPDELATKNFVVVNITSTDC